MSIAEEKTLDQRMAEALLGLEMVSYGSAQAWNASGGHSGLPDDRMMIVILRGDEPLHLVFRRRWERAFSEKSRVAVVLEAEAELKTWKKRETPADETAWVALNELILKHDIGLSPEVIATRRNVHPSFVRRLRKKHDKGMEDGLPASMAATDLTSAEKALRACELRGRGWSTRDIADQLGVSQSAVMKWIRKAAA